MILYDVKKTRSELEPCLERIGKTIYKPVADLEVTAWCTKEPVPYAERMSGEKRKLRVGDSWGELFDCAWFFFQGQVPDSARGEKVVLLIDLSGEACVVDEQGNPDQILTTGSTVFEPSLGKGGKTVVEFLDKATGGERVAIWADAGNNDLLGYYQNNGELRQACIATKNDEMEQLFYDFEVLFDLLGVLERNSSRYHRIVSALHKASVEMIDFTAEEAHAARALLAPELAKKNGDYSLHVSAIGHAHIDLAWLWPIRETIRKGARTFAHALRMMERYPDFIFGASQPQLYQWMKEQYPTVYEAITARVAEGRWEPLGGMWVECDSNVTGGESFVRQFLYGKRFFRQEFGKEVKNLFMPDTFGYSAALPQIMKKSGVDYFITTKISWDIFNKFPHDTFKWQGIDGTQVLAHMPPEGTYNSSAAPRAIKQAERKYMDKEVSENCLLVFGIGNGGGGPAVDHLERLKREKNLAGIAPVVQEPVEEFLPRLEKNMEEYKTWVGELYLARHQGTYTTQGRNKRYNRKMEIALREAELSSVFAQRFAAEPYPRDRLEKIWKEVLLYQFHDILPGSSITRVFEETRERYRQLSSQTSNLMDRNLNLLAQRVDTRGFRIPVLIFNSLSWERSVWLQIDNTWQFVHVPALGYVAVEADAEKPEIPPLTATSQELENEILRVTFAADGSISSIHDKEHDREVIESGKRANLLEVFADDGDAWDFSFDYRYRNVGQFELQASEAIIDGPRAVLRQQRTFGDSILVQEIVLTAGSRRLDFITRVDWQESAKMLRASFPVNIHTNESTSEIQFGHIKRPNHRNTSWDLSKFEISAHKWIDLSQPDYGVALLNDCKYGYQALGNVLDIHLLRSPNWPDPRADRGEHEFTYSLFPHAGDHIRGRVVQAGYELNVPPKLVSGDGGSGPLPTTYSLVQIGAENVILETIKKAEDSDAIILRMYDAYGITSTARIELGVEVKAVYETNLLEEKSGRIPIAGNSFELELGPFEIKTVSVEVK